MSNTSATAVPKKLRKCDRIESLADIRDRCYIDADTGCWNWRLSFNKHDGQPRAFLRLPDGRPWGTTGAKAAWVLSRGPVPKGSYVYRLKCQNKACVNPAHMAVGTRAEVGAHLTREGYLQNQPPRIAINTRIVRESIAKLDAAKVAEIRLSEMPNRELAVKYGVCPSAIRDIRSFRTWRPSGVASSVFNWMPSRACLEAA